MKGHELDFFMRRYGQGYYQGIYSRNCLPLEKLSTLPAAFVINTDKSDGPGQHWVASYVDYHGQVEYFDPYGLPPTLPEIRKFLRTNSRSWTHNDVMLQGINTITCGHHCLFYLYHRTRGYTLCDIQTMLQNSLYDMDEIVVQFVDSKM